MNPDPLLIHTDPLIHTFQSTAVDNNTQLISCSHGNLSEDTTCEVHGKLLGATSDNMGTTLGHLWDNLGTSLGLLLDNYEAPLGSHIDYCRRIPLPCGQHVAIYYILVFTYRWAGLLTGISASFLSHCDCGFFPQILRMNNTRIICWFLSFGRCHWNIPSFLIPIVDNNKNLLRYFRPLAFIIGWGVFCGCITQ